MDPTHLFVSIVQSLCPDDLNTVAPQPAGARALFDVDLLCQCQCDENGEILPLGHTVQLVSITANL
jgi:hypothetical protein